MRLLALAIRFRLKISAAILMWNDAKRKLNWKHLSHFNFSSISVALIALVLRRHQHTRTSRCPLHNFCYVLTKVNTSGCECFDANNCIECAVLVVSFSFDRSRSSNTMRAFEIVWKNKQRERLDNINRKIGIVFNFIPLSIRPSPRPLQPCRRESGNRRK